jgi:hypothetical protein
VIYLKSLLAGVGVFIAFIFLLSRSAPDCFSLFPLICRKVPATLPAPRGFPYGSFCLSGCWFLPQPTFGRLENLNHEAATDINTLPGDEA